jgi:AcrR family transcriptional regulator
MVGVMATGQTIDDGLLDGVIELATRREQAVAALPVDAIAVGLGMSRMTLYRRIGSRKALHDALRARGVDPGEAPGAAERALSAAADLIRKDGVASLTLEAVAARAGCALPTIYAQFGGRSGLLMAVFERHSPVLAVRQALVDIAPGDAAGFRHCVSDIYAVIVATIEREQGLLRAMLAETLRDPSSEVGQFITTRYLPSIMTHIMPWVADHMRRGVIRPLPLILIGQQLVAPIAMHVATRPLAEEAGVFEVPPLSETCDLMADLFCRAVEVTAPEERP